MDEEEESLDKRLWQAVKNGHLVRVIALHKQGADIHLSFWEDRRNLLHVAAKEGHIPVAKYLLANGLSVDDTNIDGVTPLHTASSYGQEGLVKFLLDSKANVHAKTEYGDIALHSAAVNNHAGVVMILLDNGSDINAIDDYCGETALHLASKNGHATVVQLLVDKKADIYAESKNKWLDAGKPIHYAAQHNYKIVVEIFLNAGMDVNVTNRLGWTPLQYASSHGCVSVVPYLLAHSANMHACTNLDHKPIFLAVHSGYRDVVVMLLIYGNNVNMTNNDGLSLLHIASGKGHLKLVQFLLEKNANVNARCNKNRNPLHYAAMNGYEDIVQIFINFGMEVCSMDVNRQTPLHLAAKNDKWKVVQLLVKALYVYAESSNSCIACNRHASAMDCFCTKGWCVVKQAVKLKIDSQDQEGHTALHLASRPVIMKYLLEAGARFDIKDKDGRSAVFYFVEGLSTSNTNQVDWPLVQGILRKMSDYIDIDDKEKKSVAHVILCDGLLNEQIVEFALSTQKDLNVEDINGNTPLNCLTERQAAGNVRSFSHWMQILIDHGAYLKENDCQRIITDYSLRLKLLGNEQLCTQSIINKYNMHLRVLYSLPLSIHLPSMEGMKVNSTHVRSLELAVGVAIRRNNGFCNVSTDVLLPLSMMCVKAFIGRYPDLGLFLRVLAKFK